ncbi:PREDICTED: WD repeat-containing protein 11-like [Nelumbo nucifera]|uniref:WD repeat-containing protein 11-like n=1 Tax=Nelumbo nucifera TaxID=4432 RepID=A0A1U7ZHD6_NELNU|nr:PREDICTED: WD repeat-containing protein 11-like [Nelumbo nucifera]
MPVSRSPHDTWDCMLPGPPSRNNGGSAHCSTNGLLAYGAGSSVVVVDSRTMQLISVLPMPAPSASPIGLAPFVTAVCWTPQPIRRDLLTHEPSNSHLLIAVGDRQGRIALWDFRLRQVILWLEFDSPTSLAFSDKSKPGIQDLCWIRAKADSLILASISGPSLLSLWNTSNGRCIWRYDASPEYFSCIRRDPFDFRHFCALGLKGFLLSVIVHGEEENDVVIKELHVPTFSDFRELHKVEKEGGNNPATSPALAVFPLFIVRFSFSPQWRYILFVTFPKELVVFDLQYETSLASASLPRKCGKFLDVLPDPDNDWLYCAHLDGKISIWRRKEGEQANRMCVMEEIMPSIGTSVPSPALLSVILCQSEAMLQNIVKLCPNSSHDSPAEDYDAPLDCYSKSDLVPKAHIISITDDGKIWNWHLTAEGARDSLEAIRKAWVSNSSEVTAQEKHNKTIDVSTHGPLFEAVKESGPIKRSSSRTSKSAHTIGDLSFKISLVGQLHLLSSTITTLAVPSPSLTATLARGGNYPAVAVPLIALGTQSGMIDVIDVSANAVASSFSAHSTIVRGLRWLGNSRLVSFSYVQVSEKAGGYTNRLVVTCLRSGLNRTFRVLQKPERAPIRALRASSSGRYLLILLRDAPVEVWAMTKCPIMLRSLALPFTVLEWTLPTVPRLHKVPSRQSSFPSKEHMMAPAAASIYASCTDSKTTDISIDDTSESFSFALVNGALGVFEVHGRRIRDFRRVLGSSVLTGNTDMYSGM